MEQDPKQLLNVYKKKGYFDNERKQLLDNFKSSSNYNKLVEDLKEFVTRKVKENPEILFKNKGQMAALIQGEFINSYSLEINKLTRVNNDTKKELQDKIFKDIKSLIEIDTVGQGKEQQKAD
ncbi:hypothetical protein PACTADRAFT_32921 [Pachysolen tannophilus NRRL Y-2460]|uniref:BOD1/SHG1 domain-containing protein n=1 Tax=Pachysolen tannophilus NRRL Y-2460 TaxID=669874 RepID=A0A1E4U0D0_PACTA|nr:hypothetical protein PACTADRAFT_32921 [Pachysolen tannophilus NRRL Y-2460]